MDSFELKVIARMHTDMREKFGVPRQSGMVEQLKGRIVFEPPYREAEAVRGLEEFSHIWALWGFSLNTAEGWSPTVRPPRLGGNKRMGVFATRSPFRPNPIGLSCLKLDSIEYGRCGPELYVSGVDMVDGTPIYDVKPYLPFADSIPDAAGGFTRQTAGHKLQVEPGEQILSALSEEQRRTVYELLSQDPRPGYQHDEREYGMDIAGFCIRFRVEQNIARITGCERWEEK